MILLFFLVLFICHYNEENITYNYKNVKDDTLKSKTYFHCGP